MWSFCHVANVVSQCSNFLSSFSLSKTIYPDGYNSLYIYIYIYFFFLALSEKSSSSLLFFKLLITINTKNF